MCGISTPTKFKRKTVYKVVAIVDGKYRAVFSFKKLNVGKVEPLTKAEAMSGNMAGARGGSVQCAGGHVLALPTSRGMGPLWLLPSPGPENLASGERKS